MVSRRVLVESLSMVYWLRGKGLPKMQPNEEIVKVCGSMAMNAVGNEPEWLEKRLVRGPRADQL